MTHFIEKVLCINEFSKLVGKRYRILSVIRKGWQCKYGRKDDIESLRKIFEEKCNRPSWPDNIFRPYEKKAEKLRRMLDEIKEKDYTNSDEIVLINDYKEVRKKSTTIDAMTNMFHLFGSLFGEIFYENLKKYSDDVSILLHLRKEVMHELSREICKRIKCDEESLRFFLKKEILKKLS
jgi:hypothetical protein